jgi:hypothetical protein
MSDAGDPRGEAAAETGPARRRRKALAPGGLYGGAAEPISGGSNPFDALVEVTDSFSSDDSCDSETPFESKLVLATVAHRGSRSDEELAAAFWSEISFPTSASRFWESSSMPAIAGTSMAVSVCRDVAASDHIAELKSAAAAGAEKALSAAVRGVDVRRPPRAGTWCGPCHP